MKLTPIHTILLMTLIAVVSSGPVAYGVVVPSTIDRGEPASKGKGKGFYRGDDLYNWKAIWPDSEEALVNETPKPRKDRIENILNQLDQYERENSIVFKDIKNKISKLEE